MDWSFVARAGLRYTVVYAGLTVGIALLLPYSGYLVLGCVAIGLGLVGKAVAQGGQRSPTAAEPGDAAMAIEHLGTDALEGRGAGTPSKAGRVLYAVGLIAFGLVGLSWLM